MIQSIEFKDTADTTNIRNCSGFCDITIPFCKGINIFIGENSTGKTRMLNILYANKYYDDFYIGAIIQKFPNINSESIFMSTTTAHRWDTNLANTNFTINPILTPLQEELLTKISKVIDGNVVWDQEDYHGRGLLQHYILKNNGLKIRLGDESTGLRVFTILSLYIKYNLLKKGDVFYWDIPERNLSVTNIEILIDILLELQRSGIQIFLTSHSELIRLYFETQKKKEDEIRYYILQRTGSGIICAEICIVDY